MDAVEVRVRRSIAEKRRIVELTLQSGMSVARVAQAEGVNSHQVFQWRRSYRRGELIDCREQVSALLPVVLASSDSEAALEPQKTLSRKLPASRSGIHIELPCGASLRVESGVDPATLRTVLESLRQ